MKQVISGKLYNTETAELVHKWENGEFINDFRYYKESLYKTKKGAYFISGKGGAMSKYRRSCGNNNMCGGSDIRVVSKDEAIEWLETHEGTEALEQHFSNEIGEA